MDRPVMDFTKRAKDYLKFYTDYPDDDIALRGLEKALKEAWNAGIRECAAISTQFACNRKCQVPAIERAIRDLKEKL